MAYRYRVVQSRDWADFGYWQLRSLVWRAEEFIGTEDGASYAMPPRLFQGLNWDDEESESWEDEDAWCLTPSEFETTATDTRHAAALADNLGHTK